MVLVKQLSSTPVTENIKRPYSITQWLEQWY